MNETQRRRDADAEAEAKRQGKRKVVIGRRKRAEKPSQSEAWKIVQKQKVSVSCPGENKAAAWAHDELCWCIGASKTEDDRQLWLYARNVIECSKSLDA